MEENMALRYLTAGESHGQALTAVIEGLPSGLLVRKEDIDQELQRRQQGYGRGGRMQIEKDSVNILSGVRFGYTLGSPVTLQIQNKDWPNWADRMNPDYTESVQIQPLENPRPGHADLAGAIKYGHRDLRNVLERASARETAARVSVGAVAKCLLRRFGMEVKGYTKSIGPITATVNGSIDKLYALAENSPVRCPDPAAEAKMIEAIDLAKKAGDTLGGIIEVICRGVPAGLGSHVQWDRKLDARLAAAVMSIQAIKGVEIGLGFEAAYLPGSQVHDPIGYDPNRQSESKFYHSSNNAGGIEGGMTNGEPIVIRAAMKPIATLYKALPSVNLKSKEQVDASVERSDYCAVPACVVVVEAVVALELANAFMEKFGGDSVEEISLHYESYLEYLRDI
jgi:chorismate synthase